MSKSFEEISRRAVVDELGEATRQALLFTPSVNPHLARVAELELILETWHLEHKADDPYVEEGAGYRLEVKPCQYQRELTPEAQAAAFARLKRVKIPDGTGKNVPLDLLGLFSITQAAIVKYLGEDYLDAIAPKVRAGKRTYKVIAKAAPAVALKKAA